MITSKTRAATNTSDLPNGNVTPEANDGMEVILEYKPHHA